MHLRLAAMFTVLFAIGPLFGGSVAAAQDTDGAGEAAMLARVNAIRAEAGLAALARDARLDAAARTHSADMAWNQMLEHVSPRTGSPADRVSASGIDPALLGENVAMNESTSAAQSGLEASDAHKANMLAPGFTHVGLSSVRVEGGVWVTQVFAQLDAPTPAGPAAPVVPVVPPAALEEIPAPPPPVLAEGDGAVPEAPAPPPALVAGAVESAPIPATGGPVVTVRPRPGERVAGYWVRHAGRWYYYPLPPNAQPGQVLAWDPSATGGPGSVVVQGAPVVSSQPVYRMYSTPPPPIIMNRGRVYRVYVAPPAVRPRVEVVRPRPWSWRAWRRHHRHLMHR